LSRPAGVTPSRVAAAMERIKAQVQKPPSGSGPGSGAGSSAGSSGSSAPQTTSSFSGVNNFQGASLVAMFLIFSLVKSLQAYKQNQGQVYVSFESQA